MFSGKNASKSKEDLLKSFDDVLKKRTKYIGIVDADLFDDIRMSGTWQEACELISSKDFHENLKEKAELARLAKKHGTSDIEEAEDIRNLEEALE